MRRTLSVAIASLTLLIGGATPSLAHAELDLAQTRPEKGSTSNKIPNHVIMHFTEPPTKQAAVTVLDGCGDNVVKSVSVADNDAHVFLKNSAERGQYKVSFAVVSAVDGHPTRGKYSFTVGGEPDCSTGGPSDDGTDDAAAPPPQRPDDSSFPVVPVAIGSAALIGFAFIARRLTSG